MVGVKDSFSFTTPYTSPIVPFKNRTAPKTILERTSDFLVYRCDTTTPKMAFFSFKRFAHLPPSFQRGMLPFSRLTSISPCFFGEWRGGSFLFSFSHLSPPFLLRGGGGFSPF